MTAATPLFVVAIIQARMNSLRLPGKAMLEIQGRTILGHVADRLHRCTTIDGLYVATSTDTHDDAIAAFAATEGISLHRGSPDDVAAHLRDAVTAATADALVRINADSPLIDTAIIDHAVTLFRLA